MKKLILASLCVLFAANLAWADYIELPIKWSQYPDYYGYNFLSNHPLGQTVADDFICESPAPIVAVRWWGAYTGEGVPREDQPGFWKLMDISFHLSDGGAHPFSLPLNPPLSLQTVLAQEIFIGNSAQGMAVYEYNAYLVEPFVQTPGVEYFIDIDDPFEYWWGWYTTDSHYLDFAACQSPNHIGPWNSYTGYDLAFELMVPEPATIALLGLGSLSLIRSSRRRREP